MEGEELDIHGNLAITPREALWGARKLVSIPQRRKTVVVTIPPKVSDGTRLRLRGMGRSSPHGERGDLYLTVKIARMGVS